MLNQTMYELGSKRSVIRELFEYGKRRAESVGADKVYDFSLGNPSVPAPKCVNNAIREILEEVPSVAVHGYTSAQGSIRTRSAVSSALNSKHGTSLTPDHIYMTCGAAASLCITLNALYEPNDNFVTFAPFFPEYNVFVRATGGTLTVVPPGANFQPNLELFPRSINAHTKAVIVNSPNNPSGVVFTEENILKLCDILKQKSAEYDHPIFLISDEPYREIVYGDAIVPYLPNYYDNTVVCYSYSKSLSLPGERIGYVAVSEKVGCEKELYAAICGAGRALGYVCAPSLMQEVVARCIDAPTDVDAYRENRDLLYGELGKIGFDCVYPDGAFYLFVKSLEDDANAFCDRAKELGLLIVPGNDFGAPGYVRIAYCVDKDMIHRSFSAFRTLFASYN